MEQNHSKKRVIIYGAAGFIGNPLRHYLEGLGHEVLSFDSFIRQRMMAEIGAKSLTPVDHEGVRHQDTLDYDAVVETIREFRPDAIVHLGEQRSAPYSMLSPQASAVTQHNNVVGTLNILWAMKEHAPDCHLVKLGTAGEYPDWLYDGLEIPEATRIKVSYGGRDDWEIPTPRYFGSFYHATKMYDSYNIDYACRIWGLNSTDLNQGVIYGHTDGTLFDYDHVFGTVVNRFAVQAAVGHPLTVYGEGGQTRGFISLRNALEAIGLVLQNPPKGYRIIHQVTEEHSVMSIAERVSRLTGAKVEKFPNPRHEMDHCQIKFEAKTLKSFGLQPVTLDDTLPHIIATAEKYRENADREVIFPDSVAKWHRTKERETVPA